jgi:hypothetical protein
MVLKLLSTAIISKKGRHGLCKLKWLAVRVCASHVNGAGA